jgi:hypothetical protein
MYSKMASRAAARVGQSRRWSSSTLRVAKRLSATALSKQSPTEPIDGTRPAARRRCPKASEVY